MAVRSSVLFTLLACLGGSGATAQGLADDPRVTQRLEAVRVWLEAQRAYDRVPGVSAAVVHDQQVLWSGGFGQAAEGGRATDADTLYSICSISKLFTSVAVMQQRDLGRLRLDDPVKKHLSWFGLKRAESEGEVTIDTILDQHDDQRRDRASFDGALVCRGTVAEVRDHEGTWLPP